MFNPLNNWEYMLFLLRLFLIFQKFVNEMCCSLRELAFLQKLKKQGVALKKKNRVIKIFQKILLIKIYLIIQKKKKIINVYFSPLNFFFHNEEKI